MLKSSFHFVKKVFFLAKIVLHEKSWQKNSALRAFLPLAKLYCVCTGKLVEV